MMKFKKSTNRHVHSICHQFGDDAHMIEIGYNLFDQEFQYTRLKSRTYVVHKNISVYYDIKKFLTFIDVIVMI